MKKHSVTLNFIRTVLGSAPANEDLRTQYITAKMMSGKTGMSGDVALEKVKGEIENLKKDEAYQEKIKDLGDKALTVFYRNNEGLPSISNIQIRGFFKDAFAFVAKEQKLFTKKSGEIYVQDAFYRDWIGDRIQFIEEYLPIKGNIEIFSRPLRCETMQGPRVAISSSESIKTPGPITFTLVTTNDVTEDMVKSILDRGMFRGIGQWANAQYGTFTYTLKTIE